MTEQNWCPRCNRGVPVVSDRAVACRRCGLELEQKNYKPIEDGAVLTPRYHVFRGQVSPRWAVTTTHAEAPAFALAEVIHSAVAVCHLPDVGAARASAIAPRLALNPPGSVARSKEVTVTLAVAESNAGVVTRVVQRVQVRVYVQTRGLEGRDVGAMGKVEPARAGVVSC